jgi:hypothetical protein
MRATAVRERFQVTLPQDVGEAAELHIDDQVDWRFEEREIRGRKLVRQSPQDVLDAADVDDRTLLPKHGRITATRLRCATARQADRSSLPLGVQRVPDL